MTACTIKEDRTFCPCYLTIDFVDLPLQWQNDDKSLWMDVQDHRSDVLVLETVTLTETMRNRGMRVKVPKGKALVASAGGRDRFRPSADGKLLVLPEGYQSDSLFLHARVVDCPVSWPGIRSACTNNGAPSRSWWPGWMPTSDMILN